MGGRSDYEERKQKRIERYKILSEKAKERSNQYMNSSANKTLERIPLGQPILVDHYSAKGHRNLLERAQNNIKKSIEEDKKSKFYSNRAESAGNSKAIYSDDPRAIEKLKEKIRESLSSVLPITVIVLILSITLAPMEVFWS